MVAASLGGKKALARENSNPRAHLAPIPKFLPFPTPSFTFSFTYLSYSRSFFGKVGSTEARIPPQSFEAFAYRATLNLSPLLFERVATM